jgi:hypothetical protein
LAILALAAVLLDRHLHTPPKGIGVRVIQFYTVVVLIPSIGVLALAGVIERQVVATLFGTIVGYVLSGIGKDEREKAAKDHGTKTKEPTR